MPQIDTMNQRLVADPSRVVVRPFHLAWQARGSDGNRSRRLVEDVLALSETEVEALLAEVLADFEARHWHTRLVFERRFAEVWDKVANGEPRPGEARRQLLGAYFCHEYSYAAAALMNPSVTAHPDQSGLQPGCTRFVMSLRAVGEGHISTIAFREGIVTDEGELTLMPEPRIATAADADMDEEEFQHGTVEVVRNPDTTLSGTVIFPITESQSNGLEDLRLTCFTDDDGAHEWIGTYTAYNGSAIRSELLRTLDFRSFRLQPMSGSASVNKGMGLFPRRIDGRYAMIGRQDGKNLFLLRSDRLDHWDGGTKIMEPRFPWEFIQIGNCGAPIELDEGWLLLTHGVGAMRKYSIGAALLDKADPSKVLARSSRPLLAARDHDREGYVPNVVYTCGAMRVGERLFLPYGLADSQVAFAFVQIDELLASLA